MDKRKKIINLCIGPLLFLLSCVALPESVFESYESRVAIGTVAWMAFWWVTAPVDYAVTAFLPIIINSFIPMASMPAVISNYASETIMLLLGASILTISWEETGLDKRIAAKLLSLVGSDLRNQLVIWFLISASLSSILPNSVVCATITPIAVSMLKYAGEKHIETSKVGSKILLTIVYAAGVGGLISPLGGAMNLITIDYLQQLTGEEYMYSAWVVRFFPIMVVLITSNIIFLLRNVKKGDTLGGTKGYFVEQYKRLPQISRAEVISLLLFVIATVLSFTRQLYQELLPGLKPAYIFILFAFLSFFITREGGMRLMRWKVVQTKIVWELIYVFAGGLAAGTLINESGASVAIGNAVASMNLDNDLFFIFVMIAFTIIMSDVTSNTATAAVTIPIVISIVQGMGKNPIPYVYVASIGVNLSYMLPTSIRAIPVGYGLPPIYMFKEGWKLTIIVVALMTGISYLLFTYWSVFSTV